MASQRNRAQATLDETEKGCDLGTISLSPRFKEALKISAELRDRVAEATSQTAKQALEEKSEQKEETAAAKKPRAPRSYISPVLKK